MAPDENSRLRVARTARNGRERRTPRGGHLLARRGDVKCRNQSCGLGRLISLSQKFLTSFASTLGLAA